MISRLEPFLYKLKHGIFFRDRNHDFFPDRESALFEFIKQQSREEVSNSLYINRDGIYFRLDSKLRIRLTNKTKPRLPHLRWHKAYPNTTIEFLYFNLNLSRHSQPHKLVLSLEID